MIRWLIARILHIRPPQAPRDVPTITPHAATPPMPATTPHAERRRVEGRLRDAEVRLAALQAEAGLDELRGRLETRRPEARHDP